MKFISALLLCALLLSLLVGCVPNPAPQEDPPAPPPVSVVPPTDEETLPETPTVPEDTPLPQPPEPPAVDPVLYSVTLEHDSTKGSVSGLSDSYAEGDAVHFTVTPMGDYAVDAVTCNDVPLAVTQDGYDFVITAAATIRVTYKLKPLTVALTNDSSCGTVTGLKDEYQDGDLVTFSVSPNKGWAVYSVTVNGDELPLPYSFRIDSKIGRTFQLVVTYEADTLEARRQKVVAYAKHLTGDYYHYEGGVPVAEADINNATHSPKALSADYIYRGVPYNEGLSSLAAYRTLESEFVDGVYHINPTLFVERWYWLFGLSCADVPLWAWRAVDSGVDFAAAQYMTPRYGCIQVGEYEWTLKNDLLVDTYADIAKNGSAVMDAAYAQLQPGDACTRIKGGTSVGHVIFITSVDHESGTVTYCDTNGKARSAKAMVNGMDVYRYGEFEKTVSYSWLQTQGYLPVTCPALRDESVTLPALSVTDTLEAPSAENLTEGKLTSTQAISHVVIAITDSEGNPVQEYIRYWKNYSFRMSDFASTRLLTGWDDNSPNHLPQYHLYAAENTLLGDMELEAGNYRCTVTVYNGGSSFDADGNVRSQGYVVRDFDFSV